MPEFENSPPRIPTNLRGVRCGVKIKLRCASRYPCCENKTEWVIETHVYDERMIKESKFFGYLFFYTRSGRFVAESSTRLQLSHAHWSRGHSTSAKSVLWPATSDRRLHFQLRKSLCLRTQWVHCRLDRGALRPERGFRGQSLSRIENGDRKVLSNFSADIQNEPGVSVLRNKQRAFDWKSISVLRSMPHQKLQSLSVPVRNKSWSSVMEIFEEFAREV